MVAEALSTVLRLVVSLKEQLIRSRALGFESFRLKGYVALTRSIPVEPACRSLLVGA